ncbi:MAG: hypothetical protein Q7S66_02615 [bacterium]|nr:hypothetical protein [bacterium]
MKSESTNEHVEVAEMVGKINLALDSIDIFCDTVQKKQKVDDIDKELFNTNSSKLSMAAIELAHIERRLPQETLTVIANKFGVVEEKISALLDLFYPETKN